MTFAEWVDATRSRYREHDPWTATRRSVFELLIGAGRRVGQRWNYGTTAWDREWDVLIILDACRHDLFCEVAPEYDFLPDDPDWIYSPACQSHEWMEHHFQGDYRHETARTALMSGNLLTNEDWIRPEFFGHLDEIWKHSWDDDLGTIPARPVTDASIDYWRNRRTATETDRMIAWYFQPHHPFIDADWSEGWGQEKIGSPGERTSAWQQLKNGDLEKETVWEAYRDNLQYVLDDVELLLKNLDAERVVITSDHGNGAGEFGIYGHPPYVPHPVLKRVPWVELTATDAHTYEPDYEPPAADVSEEEVSERLEALGYK